MRFPTKCVDYTYQPYQYHISKWNYTNYTSLLRPLWTYVLFSFRNNLLENKHGVVIEIGEGNLSKNGQVTVSTKPGVLQTILLNVQSRSVICTKYFNFPFHRNIIWPLCSLNKFIYLYLYRITGNNLSMQMDKLQ